jgi:hypothetical protein
VLDAISNHTSKHQGGKYMKVTLKARAEAMCRISQQSPSPTTETLRDAEERMTSPSVGLSILRPRASRISSRLDLDYPIRRHLGDDVATVN